MRRAYAAGSGMTVTEYLASLGYTTVEYIQNTAESGINTGYTHANNSDRLDIEFEASFQSPSTYSHMMSVEMGTTAKNYCILISSSRIVISTQGKGELGGYRITANTRYQLHSYIANRQLFTTVNGTQVYGSNINASTVNRSYPLFCGNGGSYYFGYTKAKIFGPVTISKNNVKQRWMFPCRSAGNEAGMYDVVNDVFYTNIGSGSFTLGGAYNYTDKLE